MKRVREISVSLEDVFNLIDARIEEVDGLYSGYKEKEGEPLIDPATQIRASLEYTKLRLMELGFRKSKESESET